MKTLHILALCGVGDMVSHITRFDALLNEYPEFKLKFWLGGHGKSPILMKEILEKETFNGQQVKVSIINNFNFHNQIPEMKKFIHDNVVKDGDALEDWSFCQEIFNNEEPIFMKYRMKHFHEYKTSISAVFNSVCYNDSGISEGFMLDLSRRVIIVHVLTKSGNAEGFEHDEKNNRFWEKEKWIELFKKLNKDNLIPTFVGIGDEDWGLVDYCKNNGIMFYNMMNIPILETIELLKNCAGCIATNSWDWTIAAHSGKPTICMYFKNHFFIKIHVPQRKSAFYDNCYIETDNNTSVEKIFDVFKFLFEKKCRPIYEYSICSIAYRDEECIDSMLENAYEYSCGDFVVVDGFGNYETSYKLQSFRKKIISDRGDEKNNIRIIENKWNDHFSNQKNIAINNARREWVVWIDADEKYEHLFWNQLPWYIWLSEKNNVDCINVPRINIISDLNKNELIDYANKNGWNISFFGWINYPDFQQRIFKKYCSFYGRTHERLVDYKNEINLYGVHCLHNKTVNRQNIGLKREHDQYILEAEKVYRDVVELDDY